MKKKNNKTKKHFKNGGVLMIIGLLLIATALCITCYNIWDEKRAEKSANKVLKQLSELIPGEPSQDVISSDDYPYPDEIDESPVYVLHPKLEMPTIEIDGRRYIGILRVPSLDLELPIMSEWSYPNLKVAPCRYVGSAYTKDLVIAAHNFRSHFGTLKYLNVGEKIVFTDTEGNRFRYVVAGIEILEPTSIEEMKSGGWALSLFTCTLGGKSRVTVRCDAVEG